MKKMSWFRLYSEMPHDERIEELAFEDRWHFVNLLCMKCSGILDKEYESERMRERKIERELGIHGDTLKHAKERLMEVGLIDKNWQPRAWDKRQFVSDHDPTAAERQRRYRERKKSKENSPVSGDNGGVTRYVTDPSQTPDTETDTDTETTSAKPEKSGSALVISIPLVSGEEYQVLQKDLDDWAESYPAVDVIQELRNIRQWNLSNPTRRKTHKGIRRHITTWLAKKQDQGGSKVMPFPRSEPDGPRSKPLVG